MKHLLALLLLLGVTVTSQASMQTDMSGEWAIQFASPAGPQEFTMYVSQEGPRLTGRFTSDAGEFPLRGSINDAEFTITWSLPDAGKVIDITFTGKVSGETLSGVAKLGTRGQGPLSGTRTGG